MQKEVSQWWRQAERDILSAEHSLSSGDFYIAAFLSQQAAEKALKALYLQEKKELLKTHNISRLAKALDLSDILLKKIAMLEPVYQETRYPDVSAKIPADEFEEKDAQEFVNIAHEVLIWIQKRIK